MTGYYRMHRGWQEHPLFGRDEFSRRDAWVWLIEHAAFKDTRVGVGSRAVEVKRGQLCYSLRYMAKAFGWDDPRVRRFLSRLSSEGMIECVVVNGQTLVTICNYGDYQAPECVGDAPIDAGTTRQRRSGDANKKEGKELEGMKEGGARATRLPADFKVSDEWLKEAEEARTQANLSPANLAAEAVKFANYFISAPGAKGRKLDWKRTWINWALGAHAPTMSAAARTLAAAADAGLLPQRSRPWKVIVDGFRRTGFWPDGMGPRPGRDGCEAPDELLTTDEIAAKRKAA